MYSCRCTCSRMLKDRTFDPLGCVAGVSFLVSGILVIQGDLLSIHSSNSAVLYSLLRNQMKKQALFARALYHCWLVSVVLFLSYL